MTNTLTFKKYQVVIVDDEQDIRERITKFVLEKSDIFDIVGTFSNGADALEGIINLEPDILITDIKIPYIEGMELIGEAIKYVPYLKSIVITGFDVFEYAKKAVELDVVGFLTKPITEQMLYDNLDKAINKIVDETKLIENEEVIEHLKQENNILIKESLFNKLLRENDLTKEFIERLNNNDLNIDYEYFQTVIFNLHDVKLNFEIETYLIQVYHDLVNLLDEDIKTDFTIKNEQLIVLIKSNSNINIEKQLQNIIIKHKRFYDNHLSVGISFVFKDHSFKTSYDQAKEALTYRSVFTNKDNVYRYLKESKALNFTYDIEQTRELRYALAYLELEESKKILNQIIKDTFTKNNQNVHYLIISNILNEVFKAVKNVNKLVEKIGNINEYYLQFLNMHSQTKLLEKLYNLLELITVINNESREDISKSNTTRILSLIEANYKKTDFNLEQLADDVNLSVSYISLLLKERNMSFVKYLTELRIKEAERLLLNSNLKIIEIAEEVGYLDPYYFSHAFKKNTGYSPRKFREINEKS